MFRCAEQVSKVRGESAHQIEDDELPTPEHVLDTSAEEVEIDHVAEEMKKACMHEEAGDISVPDRFVRSEPDVSMDPAFDVLCVAVLQTGQIEDQFDEIDQRVDAHQREGHHR